ncbi:MAG: hypothetical protein RIS35_2429 [Pseudomonadota bacterium]
MPFRLTWEPFGVVSVFFGQVSPQDLFDSRKAIDGDARRARLRYCILDYRAAQGLDIRTEDCAALGRNDRRGSLNGTRLVCGVISPDESMRQAVDRYKSTLEALYPMEVFATLAETRNWVDLQLRYMALNGAGD